MKIFILFSLIQIHLTVDLKTLRMMFDRGLDEVKTPKINKQYIYQRIKLEFNHENTVQLNYGLNNETFTSQIPLDFKIDLQWPDVMINAMNSRGCLEGDSCAKDINHENKNSNYQTIAYSYFTAKGYLGFNRIRPGELDILSTKEIDNYLQLPLQFYSSDQLTANVLGLSPKSNLWKYWESMYHFPSKRINLSIIFKQDQPLMVFDSAIDTEKEILYKVAKNKDSYQFAAVMNFESAGLTASDTIINVCIANQADQTFRIEQKYFHLIKESLCKKPSECAKVSDLKDTPKFSLQVAMKDYQRADAVFTSTFFVSSLYKIKGDDIIWKIDQTTLTETNQGCQLILEQNFLAEKQLMISNDLNDPEFLYIGFKVIDPSEFSKLNFYSIIMVLMFLLSISLFVIYMILNHSLNKLLKKENLA